MFFHSLRAALLVLLAFAVGKMMYLSLDDFTGDLRGRQLAYVELNQLESLVKETSGPILADEYMGMLTLQGRSLVMQPFEVTQLAWAGKWDQTPLLNSIKEKEYAAIIIYDQPWAKERWTQEMFDAINGSYVLSDMVAGNKIYKPYQRKTTESLRSCPGAAWQLPGDASLGVKWENGSLDFFARGNEGKVPVYAVADGLLTRLPDWVDAVAIQHDDPLQPGEKVWSYYADMSAANGVDSFIVEHFPVGAANIPVKAGQLIGYQGSWSGRPSWPMWIHVRFRVIQISDPELLPEISTLDTALDPSPYLKLSIKSQNETPNLQPLICSTGQ